MSAGCSTVVSGMIAEVSPATPASSVALVDGAGYPTRKWGVGFFWRQNLVSRSRVQKVCTQDLLNCLLI
jgi:hypothetical protein